MTPRAPHALPSAPPAPGRGLRARAGRHRSLMAPVLAALVAAALAWLLAERWANASLHETLDRSLLLTARAVEAEIDRFRALPDVAGEDARIRAALIDPRALDAANRYLETISAHGGAADLFLINAQGQAIAASNWNRPSSFVGEYYNFRPYFTQAMETGRGQFYAIGVTTGVPGYFLSTRVTSGNQTGVLVVKLDLRPLQATWRSAGAQMALADADGVIFLSGREDWLYRPLAPLAPETLQSLTATRTYDGVDLAAAAPLLPRAPLGADATGDGWIARLTGVDRTGWRLIAASPSGDVTGFASGWALIAALLALAAASALKSWEQRRQLVALRLSQSERLETMVATRTADLAREVEARAQAEADLRAAQEHLIHAEKMAALGRMSTAIVHEISQPLAAMEATLAAAEIGLPPSDARTAPRLATARGLIRRMQRTTKHLKSFGRKETGDLTLIDLAPVVASALELVTPRARAVGVIPAFTAASVPVLAGAVRMEQVAVNLILNALDAVEGQAGAAVTVTLAAHGPHAILTVADTGPGIAPDVLPRVTEPFFSTKTSGEGLGLGLAISKAILSEFGGDLAIASTPAAGTTVTVTLPRATTAREAAE
ncbi:ATP-binding protein [Pseudorhodobacter sp. MZDSW-24AT]|uniref:sensor histidine kinase n=1 Tax=Pseudorhodobacter sp. MZDSW-24AT TaxID=2052957 RepID=UPI000C1E5AA1|nr:ATP-binding protein [Pseudorhodobacter sp. MZDSW-24AT]PJF08788.1 sensor histidine kinase [Pseudorhodobacter sp. MZDSW-24AT]